MLTKRSGVCGSPSGYPDGVYMKSVQLGWLRSLVTDIGTFEAMYNQVPQGTNVVVVLTGQTEGLANDFWSDGWRDRFSAVVRQFCERFYKKVRIIEFMNEWDFWNNDDKIQKAVEIAVLGTSICKEYGILGLLGSVASGDWVNQLAQASHLLDTIEAQVGYKVVHGFAFHPYMSYVERTGSFVLPGHDQQPNSGWIRLSDKVKEAIQVCGGRACAVTEIGIKIGDVGGESNQATYVHGVFQDELALLSPSECMCMCYFAWCDQNGAPSERGDSAFGLIGEQGNLREAYRAATYQFRNSPVEDVPVFDLLATSEPAPSPSTPSEETPPTTQTKSEEAPATMTAEQAHALRWRALVPDAEYNHTFGFESNWRKAENAWWGSPVTKNESTLDDKRPLRIFANAVVAYNADGTCEVLH